ncbi:MAG: tripartite tricarboxylate transporter TctB family protein [Burkholderiaceae bacterium]
MRYVRERLDEFIAAVVTAAIGAFIIVEASSYAKGTLTDMGPGYFPIVLGSVMILLAVIMLVTARTTEERKSVEAGQLRGTFFVAVAFIAFAFTIEAAGMLVSVFLAVFVSALGNRNTSWLTAALLAVATAVISALVFRVGLGLQIEAY